MDTIVFLVGDSGSGKTTQQERLIALNPELYTRIISTTSREPRDGEVDHKDYHFISESDFYHRIDNHKFLQFVNYGGNHYGTLLSEYEQPQKIGLFVCTPEGINDTKNALESLGYKFNYEIVFFFVTKGLLERHGVDEYRKGRGSNFENFNRRYFLNEFEGIPITLVQDREVNANLHNILNRRFENA